MAHAHPIENHCEEEYPSPPYRPWAAEMRVQALLLGTTSSCQKDQDSNPAMKVLEPHCNPGTVMIIHFAHMDLCRDEPRVWDQPAARPQLEGVKGCPERPGGDGGWLMWLAGGKAQVFRHLQRVLVWEGEALEEIQVWCYLGSAQSTCVKCSCYTSGSAFQGGEGSALSRLL